MYYQCMGVIRADSNDTHVHAWIEVLTLNTDGKRWIQALEGFWARLDETFQAGFNVGILDLRVNVCAVRAVSNEPLFPKF